MTSKHVYGDYSRSRTFCSRSFRDPNVVHLVARHTDVNRDERERYPSFVPMDREQPTVVTGGAKGVDTLAETLAHSHGYRVEVILPTYQTRSSHPSSTLVRMTPSMQNEGAQKVWEANTTLQRNLKQTTLQWGLLQRNYWIIKDVELVIALGYSVPNNPNIMGGGTGWSVQLAKDRKKPLVVFKDEAWYKYDYSEETFQPSTRPRVHPLRTAIVGTRNMTPAIVHELSHLLEPHS